MRKLCSAVALVLAFTGLLYISPAAAAPVPIVCNSQWQVIPPQAATDVSTVYGGSAFNGSGQDYIGVVAIHGLDHHVYYSVLNFANASNITWGNQWVDSTGWTYQQPRVLNASESGYNKVEIRVLGTEGDTWSMIFNANGPSGWFVSGFGSQHFYNAPVHNAFQVQKGAPNWVWFGTYLGAPTYHCWH